MTLSSTETERGWKTVGRKRMKKKYEIKKIAGLPTILETFNEDEDEVYSSSEEAGDFRASSLSPSPPLIIKQNNYKHSSYGCSHSQTKQNRLDSCALSVKLDNIKDKDQFLRRTSGSMEKSSCAQCKSYLSTVDSFVEYFQKRNTAPPERSTLDTPNIQLLEKAKQSRQNWKESQSTRSQLERKTDKSNVNVETSKAVNICKSEVLPFPKSQQQNKLTLIQELLKEVSIRCKNHQDNVDRMLFELQNSY